MAQQTFRSALNGFHREDVVRYIEFLNAQHAAEITQLNSELAFLRSKAEQEVPAPTETACDDNSELIEQQAARIRELFDRCKEQEQEIESLKAQLMTAQNELLKSQDERLKAQDRIIELQEEAKKTLEDRARYSALLEDNEAKTKKLQETEDQLRRVEAERDEAVQESRRFIKSWFGFYRKY